MKTLHGWTSPFCRRAAVLRGRAATGAETPLDDEEAEAGYATPDGWDELLQTAKREEAGSRKPEKRPRRGS